MLGEAYRFIQILDWAREAISPKREEDLASMSIDSNQQDSTTQRLLTARPHEALEQEKYPWASYPNVQKVVKKGSEQLASSFYEAVYQHLKHYDLKVYKPYEPAKYMRYRKLMMQSLQLQYQAFKRPIQFPDTLNRLGPEENGFVVWQSAIRCFFDDIAQEVEKTDMSDHPYVQAQVKMYSAAIRDETKRYIFHGEIGYLFAMGMTLNAV